jgi:mono/diheme cytochrome c family protein
MRMLPCLPTLRLPPRPNAAAGIALFAAVAVSLSGCGRGDKSSPPMAEASMASGSPAAMPAGAAMSAGAATGTPDGRQVYQKCAVCHQATGQGIASAFPPLAGSEWATTANAALPIRIVLHGLQGPVTVKNQRFNGAMPAYGTGQPLSDAEVAAVLTYIRSAWGNKASAVTDADVAKERSATASRTTPWTANDLAPLLGTP